MWFTMGETERANREWARAEREKARADAEHAKHVQARKERIEAQKERIAAQEEYAKAREERAKALEKRVIAAGESTKATMLDAAKSAVGSARAILKLIIEVRDDAVAADPKRAEYIADLNAEILRAARNLNDAHTILNRRLTDHINGRQPE